MRSIQFGFIFFAASISTAADKMRHCVYTGLTVKCGEARSIVECDGFKEAFYLADDEAVFNLTLSLSPKESALDREIKADLAVIERPTLKLPDYNALISAHGEKFLEKDEIKKVPPNQADAVKEIRQALANRKSRRKIDTDDDELTVGSFDIAAEAKLYRTCFKAKGDVKPNQSASQINDIDDF